MAPEFLSGAKNSINEKNARAGNHDSASASCVKCVTVLRELIAGLHDISTSFKGTKQVDTESPPLILLKAIAGGASNGRELSVEMIDDGIKLHVPVETTPQMRLQSWRQWFQPKEGDADAASILGIQRRPLALSVNDHASNLRLRDPLTIELRCRKCANSGPEAGARAFLMGPNPLSVIVCYNRVNSDRAEVEEILTHELMHLYDVQTLRLDLQECENLAYSEVRAAKAAECRSSWHPHLQSYCVKQKAICATNNLFPSEGRACIQKVFEHAFRDNRPFERHEHGETNFKASNSSL